MSPKLPQRYRFVKGIIAQIAAAPPPAPSLDEAGVPAAVEGRLAIR
jgi:hypothetical protein